MNIFLIADDKSFALLKISNETLSVIPNLVYTCMLIFQINVAIVDKVHWDLLIVKVFDRTDLVYCALFCKASSWRRQTIWSDVIKILLKTNQKTILNRNKRRYMTCWLEFHQCKSMIKEQKHFTHLYTDDKKYRFSIIPL